MIGNNPGRARAAAATLFMVFLSPLGLADDGAPAKRTAGASHIDEIVVVAHKDERAIREIARSYKGQEKMLVSYPPGERGTLEQSLAMLELKLKKM